MEITKIHPITGKANTLEIDITSGQIYQWAHLKKPIQQVAPHLTADEREFLINGLLPGEFDKLYPDKEDDYDAELDEPAF